LVSIIAHGRRDPTWMALPDTGGPAGRNDDEMRKRLVTLTSEGVSLAVLDNLPRGEQFSSPALDNFLTSDAFHDRGLCTNKTIGGINRCLLLATGNNVMPSGDTADRTLLVRLYSRHPDPRSRPETDFQTPHVLDFAQANAARYLGAALTI